MLKVIVQRADLHEADVDLLRGVIKALAEARAATSQTTHRGRRAGQRIPFTVRQT